MRQFLAIAAIAIMAAAMPAFAADTGKPATISIDGSGEVMAAPDTAFVTSGVTTQGKTAREALDANTRAMTALVAALKTAGIDSKDIQTSGFSVNPQYVYANKPDANGYTPPPVIAGYQVENAVNVHIRVLKDLGAVLDQMVTVGANTINGVSFSVADPAKALEDARKAAFADAKSKAQTYADAAGIALGPIVSIVERNTGGGPRPLAMKAMAIAAAPAPVPVEAGQLSYGVNVSVQWQLAQGK